MANLNAYKITNLGIDADGSLNTSGAYSLTLTVTEITDVTLPASGTLATTANIATHAALLTGVHGLAITAGKTLTVQDDVTITGALGTAAYGTLGTGASNVVQLDGDSKLPAVDGSELTNLPSGGGDVVGPASATDGAVALFDETTGKLLKDGVVLGTAAQDDTGDFEASGAIATHAALLTGVHGLAITSGKTLTVQDDVTITGALGSAAYTALGDYQVADDSLTSIAGLTYATDSFIKLTAEDTYAVRTIAETKTDLSLNNVTNESKATMFTSPTFTTDSTLDYATASELLGTDASKKVVSLPVATYPSLTELAYVKGVTSAIQTQIDTKQANLITQNAQTGTSYTLVLTDINKIITMSNASANALTIPLNASVAYATGTTIVIQMINTGVTTISGDTGVTVNGVSAGSSAMTQYQAITITKIATDTWLAIGGTFA